jgi:transcriptional regulator with XRE-family HTH domain
MNKQVILSSRDMGDYIRKIRIRKAYSQYFMANAMKISQNAYCLIENGQTKITLEHLNAIIYTFDLTCSQFLYNYFEDNK